MSHFLDAEDSQAANPGTDLPNWPAEMRYITRQPIHDLRGRVHGYELLFQMSPEGETPANGQHATRTILDNLVLFGYDRLTSGMPTFIPCTEEALTEQLVTILPPSMTVLEIPQNIPVSTRLLDACGNLKQAGFRLALVGFTLDSKPDVRLSLVDYVKVDFNPGDAPGNERLRQRLKGTSVSLIADNVHSQEAFRRAHVEEFQFFQGVYFCNIQPIPNAKVPANRLFHVEILRQLFRDPLNLDELCPLVMRDASLVYRILRVVNSPICAIRQEVTSIRTAIVILGENIFRRIATLAIQCELNTRQPPEILHMSLVRARFCELAAHLRKLDPSEQYLLGMLSMLPAMLRVPMAALAPELPLRPAIVDALLGAETPERCLLSWIESLERGKFEACHRIAGVFGLSHEKLNRFYVEAAVWDAMDSASSP